jgi:hypothetical protein
MPIGEPLLTRSGFTRRWLAEQGLSGARIGNHRTHSMEPMLRDGDEI